MYLDKNSLIRLKFYFLGLIDGLRGKYGKTVEGADFNKKYGHLFESDIALEKMKELAIMHLSNNNLIGFVTLNRYSGDKLRNDPDIIEAYR